MYMDTLIACTYSPCLYHIVLHILRAYGYMLDSMYVRTSFSFIQLLSYETYPVRSSFVSVRFVIPSRWSVGWV